MGKCTMTFAEKFKTARREKKLTQKQLADELNIDCSAIAHYESGTAKPQLKNVRKLCEILDLSYEDFID